MHCRPKLVVESRQWGKEVCSGRYGKCAISGLGDELRSGRGTLAANASEAGGNTPPILLLTYRLRGVRGTEYRCNLEILILMSDNLKDTSLLGCSQSCS